MKTLYQDFKTRVFSLELVFVSHTKVKLLLEERLFFFTQSFIAFIPSFHPSPSFSLLSLSPFSVLSPFIEGLASSIPWAGTFLMAQAVESACMQDTQETQT